jgi:Zn finger protein HypA/HybF involved in hydrogenase expression
MIKNEILCETCDNHYIIITQSEEQDPIYCPFCQTSLAEVSEEE